MEAHSDNSTDESSSNLLPLTGEGIIIDIGTGDGTFVYQSARQNPKKFYIGIDANARPLTKISERIRRRPSKGGVPNVLFVNAPVEDLPPELDGVANELHIHFPWGSLLKAFATGDITVLRNVRRLCAADALLEVVVGLDAERDRTEIVRLELEPLSVEFIDTVLVDAYQTAGFEILERGILPVSEWPEFKTSWAKRLRGAPMRQITYLIARAV